MRFRVSLLLAVLLSPAAAAQDFLGKPFTDAAGLCEVTASSTASKPAAIAAACEKSEQSIITARIRIGEANLTPHARNIYAMTRKQVAWKLAETYGRIDGRISKRVCEKLETGWLYGWQIAPANSPSDMTENLRSLQWSGAGQILACRRDFGTPPGAPPVPALPPLTPAKPPA